MSERDRLKRPAIVVNNYRASLTWKSSRIMPFGS